LLSLLSLLSLLLLLPLLPLGLPIRSVATTAPCLYPA
jgi:hypothetical protein